jgi:hypothetical protein
MCDYSRILDHKFDPDTVESLTERLFEMQEKRLDEAVRLLRDCPGLYTKWRDRSRWLERRNAFLERMGNKDGQKKEAEGLAEIRRADAQRSIWASVSSLGTWISFDKAKRRKKK